MKHGKKSADARQSLRARRRRQRQRADKITRSTTPAVTRPDSAPANASLTHAFADALAILTAAKRSHR